MGKIWPNLITKNNINEAPFNWSVLPQQNRMMKIRLFTELPNQIMWCCEIVTGFFWIFLYVQTTSNIPQFDI